MVSRKQIDEYDVLRVILAVLVILGHCTYYQIATNSYGSCDYSMYTEPGLSALYRMAVYATALIYTFHMPLYMMLSGALFRYTEKMTGGGRYDSLRALSTVKAKKLLIPFIVVTICYEVPLKYVSNYYVASKDVIKDVFVGQILLQGNNHLWFLPTLFCAFILEFCMNHYCHNSLKAKTLILFMVSCFSDFASVALIGHVLRYVFWFHMGYCFEDHREQINLRVESNNFMVARSTCLWLILAFINVKLPQLKGVLLIINKFFSAACALMGCFIVYGCSYLLGKGGLPRNRFFQRIRRHTLGLYLYSDPLNYIIMFYAVRWMDNCAFVTNVGALCVFAMRAILPTIIAYGISCKLQRWGMVYLC